MFACVLAIASFAGSPCALAGEQVESFDGEQTSWTVEDSGGASVKSHRLDRKIRFGEGRSSEAIDFFSPRAGGTLSAHLPLKASRVFPELSVSTWIRSNRPGAVVLLRIVFPNQKDPETGNTLFTYLRGDTYNSAGKWQQLRCTTTNERIQKQLIIERARIREPNLNHQDLYVDRVYIAVPISAGPGEIYIDELHFGPIVDPHPDKQVETVAGEAESERLVELRLGRLEVNGMGVFPLVVPYHGEPIETFKQAGFNVVLIPGIEDQKLLAELKQNGMWAAAEPPCARSSTGEILDARTAGIMPFGDETSPILMWYAGTRIPGDKRENVVAWNEQVRRADRRFRRPIAGDVLELERVYSRQIELLSSSRHIIGTTSTFKEYRDWLDQKRKLAIPGTFPWTWIQTEPVAVNSQWRDALDRHPIVVEPEQITLQVYAAISAGCRAIGFWDRTSLDDNSPGAQERRLIMTMINLEIQLLEPWLAAGNVMETVPFTVGESTAPRIGRKDFDALPKTREGKEELKRLAAERRAQEQQANEMAGELEAAIIESHHGTLVLPVMYDRNAQFVPGQMAAFNASLVVPGVHDSAQAWEVTPTSIRTLSPGDSPGSPSVRKRVPGGLKITIKKIDQKAQFILSPDPKMKEKYEARMHQVAPLYSRAAIDLAKLKLARVRIVDEELRALDILQSDAPQLLSSAQEHIEQAEASYERKDFDAARIEAADAMQAMRILQRAHWNQALRMSSPISSPYTICFQTLPDHWRMVSRLGRMKANPPKNLLASGNFEDQEIIVANWFHSQNNVEGVRAAAELYPASRKGSKGSYALRMIAVPATGIDTPKVISQSPVTVTTPPVPVTEGQLVHISGMVRVTTPVSGSLDGIMFYDNLSGTVGALRFRDKCNWQPFELVREVGETGDLSLTMSLSGIGEVQFDDLKIVPLDPRSAGEPGTGKGTAGAGGRGDLLRFLNPWQGRKPRADVKPKVDQASPDAE